jgi:cysteine synthase B
MKEKNPGIVVVEVQPESEFHGIEGLKYMKSALRPGLYSEEYADTRFFVKTEEAIQTMRELHRREGVLAGSSGGAALAAASRLVEELRTGVVVVILPDGYTNQLPETR